MFPYKAYFVTSSLSIPARAGFPRKNGAGCSASRKGGISPKKRGRLLRFPQGRDFPEKTGQAAPLPARAGFPRKNGAGCSASRKGGISPKKRGRLLRFPQRRDFPEKTGQAAPLPAKAGFRSAQHSIIHPSQSFYKAYFVTSSPGSSKSISRRNFTEAFISSYITLSL